MLTLLMFLTVSEHLLEREREKNGTKKHGAGDIHLYIIIYQRRETDRRGLQGKCLRAGGSWLSEAADYKNSHHIAYPHLHRCSVSAIPVLGFVGN